MSELHLAALLCSRICHDLVSPVGAVTNGLEILADEDDPEIRREALLLVGDSAAQAARRLQFVRLAFGAVGSLEAAMDMHHAAEVTRAYYEGGKIALDWRVEAEELPHAAAKLVLNLALLGGEALPRGGRLVVESTGGAEGEAIRIVVTAYGTGARLPDEHADALAGKDRIVTPRAAPACYVSRLAATFGTGVAVETAEDAIGLTVELPPGAA
jgi:histidine phosphotransferase ChpT